MTMKDKRMELLSPAGDFDALRAAVQNGADAVYLGAGGFNARRNAGNFDAETLPRAVAYCHARGVKVHAALNTLVREDEMDRLAATAAMLNLAGVDAVIVQDPGVARALKQMAPALALHASTQMAVHNRQGVDFLAANGFSRVVLAREMTFEEMADCTGRGVEIEAFIHGALCVACSGQCLMSSLVGGRSGNRGLCAQPCRLPWRLDGHSGYLLSTRDLCGLENLDRYRAAGVVSLKIEGRLKRAEYVAVTTGIYRRALNAMAEGRTGSLSGDVAALRQMFNRGGFTRGYGPGVEERDLMYAVRPNHLGVEAGRCTAAGRIALKVSVLSGDALVLRRDGGEEVPVRLSGAAGEQVQCPAARPGDRLFRLVSEVQMRSARESFDGERRRISISAQAVLRVGRPAELRLWDGTHEARAVGETVEAAVSRPLDAARAAAQIGKTGDTPYEIAHLSLELDEGAFCTAAALNALRREGLEKLNALRTAVTRECRPLEAPPPLSEGEGPKLLLAQSGDPAVLALALNSGADRAVFAPEDVRREGLDAALDALPERFDLAVPAVLTGDALAALNAWARRHGDRIETAFLSNIGQFALDWPGVRAADFLMNAGNRMTVAQLADWGVEIYAPSVELTAAQIDALDGQKCLTMWGRIPLMHLRHCPLRAVEGMPGKHRECSRCDGEQGLKGRCLTDRRGMAFPLVRIAAPDGCVIQVLNGPVLMPLRQVNRLPRAQYWRMLFRSGEPVAQATTVYRAALDGRDFRAMPEWGAIEGMNTTSGHYFRGVE